MGMCGACTWLVPVEVVTLTLKDYIPTIFTSEPIILQAINVHFYVMAVTIFCDAVHSCLSGAIIGSGWQFVGAVLNVMCFWIVGIPLAATMALVVRLGALGYLIGEATATFLMVFAYTVAVAAMNWKKRAEVAQKRAALYQDRSCQESGFSSNKDVYNPKQTISQNNAHSKLNSANGTDLDQGKTMKNTSNAKGTPPSSAAEPSSECSNLESKTNGKNKNKSTITWKIVVVRILTATPFIILCFGAMVISQVLVYNPVPCNRTIVDNELECIHPHSFQSDVLLTMSSGILCSNSAATVGMSIINPLPSPTPTHMPTLKQE